MCEAERLEANELSFGNVDLLSPSKRSIQPKLSYPSTCRICLSCLLEPARLVCGHKFCEHCLDGYWKANDEPEFVVCPLCRGFACKIGFCNKEKINSTRDLRRKFDPEHTEVVTTSEKTDRSLLSKLYFRLWPIIMPIIYIVLRVIKPLLLDLLLMF